MLSPFITQHLKQSHLFISPLISSEKSVGFEAVTRWWMQSFPIFDFPLESSIFSLTTDTIGCFSWSDRLMLFIFEKMSARYPNVNNHSLFIIHPRRKWCSMERAPEFSSETVIQMLSLQIVMVRHAVDAFLGLPLIFVIQNVKRMCI